MADVVLQAVIRKAVEIASNQVIQETSRLSRVKENIDWIQSEMSLIQSYLKDADAKEAAGDKAVATWVTQIRDLGLDVEDILEKYFPEIGSPEKKKKKKGLFGCLRSACGIFGYIYTAHKFTGEVEGIKTRVNEIHRRRLTYGIQEKSGSGEGASGTWDARRSFPHVDEPNVVGFEEHIKKLKARMLDRNSLCGVISITGIAGLGKTTLAKKIYNSVQQNFECSAWVCVSQQPNVPELLRDIARQVGLEKEKCEHNVEANLYSFLLQKRGVVECVLGRLQPNVGESGNDHSIEALSVNLGFLLNWVKNFWFPKFTSLRKLGVTFLEKDWSKMKVLLDAVATTTTTVPNNKLEILRLIIFRDTQFNIVELNLCRYENLSRLHLQVRMVKLPEHDELPQNLTKLTLRFTYWEKDPMET